MKRRRSSQKGAAAVEFAIILPLLLLILFGIIEFSLLMYNKAMITNASREGARRGIVFRVDPATGDYNPLSNGEIETEVTNYLSDHLITLKGTSTHTTTITRTGDNLKVQVAYPYNFLIVPPIAKIAASDGGELPGDVTLISATEMRME